MLLCVFAVKEDCCSEKEEGSGKEHCQKKGPQQVLSAAWLASTQFFWYIITYRRRLNLRVEFEQEWGEK